MKKQYFHLFCQALTEAYPDAVKIRLAQDNLNTHDIKISQPMKPGPWLNVLKSISLPA